MPREPEVQVLSSKFQQFEEQAKNKGKRRKKKEEPSVFKIEADKKRQEIEEVWKHYNTFESMRLCCS